MPLKGHERINTADVTKNGEIKRRIRLAVEYQMRGISRKQAAEDLGISDRTLRVTIQDNPMLYEQETAAIAVEMRRRLVADLTGVASQGIQSLRLVLQKHRRGEAKDSDAIAAARICLQQTMGQHHVIHEADDRSFQAVQEMPADEIRSLLEMVKGIEVIEGEE